MYKVFIKNTSVSFATSKQKEGHYCVFTDADLKGDSQQDIWSSIDEGKEVFILGDPVANMAKLFADHQLIIAGGGLVKNNRQEYLMIFRNGHWDLPKGKLDPGERVAHCAVREVEEECGIAGLAITEELPSTYHTYAQRGNQILKRTYWYEMYLDSSPELVPQIEEGITEAVWLSKEEVLSKRDGSYSAIAELLNTYFEVD